jgi:hypothetical protein
MVLYFGGVSVTDLLGSSQGSFGRRRICPSKMNITSDCPPVRISDE